jgi:ribose 5-phosphate isomerase B
MIAIGSDHAGFCLKEQIIKHLKSKNIQYKDFGTFDEQSVDYPDYSQMVSESVASGEYEKGILICGTGIGVSIVANKVKGVRAALCTDSYMAKMARNHNNANVLALGQRVVGAGLALDIVETFITTDFTNGKNHVDRLEKIKSYENKVF